MGFLCPYSDVSLDTLGQVIFNNNSSPLEALDGLSPGRAVAPTATREYTLTATCHDE